MLLLKSLGFVPKDITHFLMLLIIGIWVLSQAEQCEAWQSGEMFAELLS